MRKFAPFGSSVPFSEPSWYSGSPTNLYGEEHVRLRASMRSFVDEQLVPLASLDETGGPSAEQQAAIRQAAVAAGIYGVGFPTEFGGKGGEYDGAALLIVSDELARCAVGGLVASTFVMSIALPPLLAGIAVARESGDAAAIARATTVLAPVVRGVLAGTTTAALAVTEPGTGSDVAAITTTAAQSVRNGKTVYVVNGSKKFITGGLTCDYYTAAVRTGGSGAGGISVLLIPRNTRGVSVRRMATQGWCSSQTAFVVFEDVEVPLDHLVGQEGMGFPIIMRNFNRERFGLAVQSVRYARLCIEDAIEYGCRRRTFGKPLLGHQVIRAKVAEMARRVEAAHALNETIAVLLSDRETDPIVLASRIALAKVEATLVMELCAREASQILGGNSFVRGSGPGERIERIYREARVNVVGGGSAEILSDLAIRMNLRGRM